MVGPATGVASGKLSETATTTSINYFVKKQTGKTPVEHVLSENQIKTIDANKAKILKNHGLNTDSFTHSINRYHKNYDVTEVGFNFRLDDIRSSLLINQINKIHENNFKRHKIFLKYLKLLKFNNKLKVLFSNYKINNYSRHLFVILTENKKKIQKKLKQNQISFSCHYKPISKLKVHRNKKKFDNSNYLFKNMISLPIYPELKNFHIKKICKVINSC